MTFKVRLRREKPIGTREPWRSRIVAHESVDPRSLSQHPDNWRKHPDRQRSALRGSLDAVGWVGEIIVNKRTGRIVDGHARVEEAVSKGECEVPVSYVDLDEQEEKLVLATLDPIGALAEADNEKLQELVGSITQDGEHVGLLADTFDDDDGGNTLDVEEIETSTVQDEFWVSVRGPLPSQPGVLERLKAALEALPGVTVEVGGVEGL
jgi:hypothetical protein